MAASGPGRGGLFFAVQLAAGAPFLVATPMEYLRASFDFGRVFTHKIVVGEWQAGPLDRHWRPPLALYRLPPACHCRLPATAACRPLPHATAYCRLAFDISSPLRARGSRDDIRRALSMFLPTPGQLQVGPLHPHRGGGLALFCCNFIGVATARSLHFQFYVWYYFSLPFCPGPPGAVKHPKHFPQ